MWHSCEFSLEWCLMTRVPKRRYSPFCLLKGIHREGIFSQPSRVKRTKSNYLSVNFSPLPLTGPQPWWVVQTVLLHCVKGIICSSTLYINTLSLRHFTDFGVSHHTQVFLIWHRQWCGLHCLQSGNPLFCWILGDNCGQFILTLQNDVEMNSRASADIKGEI